MDLFCASDAYLGLTQQNESAVDGQLPTNSGLSALSRKKTSVRYHHCGYAF